MKINSHKLRIIAGKWRGRKINFVTSPGVRPTPNRVRETLFNWLASSIKGAKCLDCFAGSGVLGFEALSRGAAWVTMIDGSLRVIKKLKENAEILDATNIDFIYTRFPPKNLSLSQYDLVFIDPPYHENLIAPSCIWLEENNCLSDNALIYIEAEKQLSPLPIPSCWQILKSQKAGNVAFYLTTKTIM